MRSLDRVQIAKNTINVGTEIIIAIMEPLATISFMVNFFVGDSANDFR